MSESHDYRLYYWGPIPGRGEPVRMLLEEAALPYTDVGRLPEDAGGGVATLMAPFKRDDLPTPLFAAPVLQDGDLWLSQSTNICLFLAQRHGLAGDPKNEGELFRANQLALTIADLIDETHDTHHPISVADYYEAQKPEAARRTQYFREARMPKYFGYLERALKGSGGPWLLGGAFTYVDLLALYAVQGLDFAFPNRMAELAPSMAALRALCERTASRENTARYLDSDRRKPFSDGVFRHYPELDPPAQ